MVAAAAGANGFGGGAGGASYAGGLVGYNNTAMAVISNSYASGNVLAISGDGGAGAAEGGPGRICVGGAHRVGSPVQVRRPPSALPPGADVGAVGSTDKPAVDVRLDRGGL